MILGTIVRWAKLVCFLQQHNQVLKFEWVKTPVWCLHTSSFLRADLDLCLKGKGCVLFFHNSLLHSNVRFTPSASWVGGGGLCFKLKSITNDWPQCPEATWWQSGEEWRTSSVFITVLRSLPLLKKWDTKRRLLASPWTSSVQEQKYWRMLDEAQQAHVGQELPP